MSSRIILAADKLPLPAACALAEKVGARVGAVKIHDLYDRHGAAAIADLREAGAKVWVDFKIHDIPETAGHRVGALRENGANIITVHASGGVEMMKAAVAAAGGAEIFAVTVLTSLDEDSVADLYTRPVSDVVQTLARWALQAGVHGIVCSPREAALVAAAAKERNASVRIVTPGIRSAGKDTHDQKRIDTPRAALVSGATDLVIGRQITLAPDPVAALAEIETEIA